MARGDAKRAANASKERKKERDMKWRRAEKVRRNLTAAEKEAEEARLIEEAAALAAMKGLDAARIGQGWGRPPAIGGLRTKGVGE